VKSIVDWLKYVCSVARSGRHGTVKTKDAPAPAVSNQSFKRQLAGKQVVRAGKFDWHATMLVDAVVKLHGGEFVDALSPKVAMLILPDLTQGKVLQKKVESLNKNGATIQVIDYDDLTKTLSPTDEQVVQALRMGGPTAKAVADWARSRRYGRGAPVTLAAEDFGDANLGDLDASYIVFESCDFSGIKAHQSTWNEIARCTFHRADLRGAKISREVDADGSDFTGADLSGAMFFFNPRRTGRKSKVPWVFKDAKLDNVTIRGPLDAADFSGADLSKAKLFDVVIPRANFAGATLVGAELIGAELPGANFTDANLRDANLGTADLTDADLSGADLTGTNLASAKVTEAQLAKARNVDKAHRPVSAGGGAALAELDKAVKGAQQIKVGFQVTDADGKAQDVEMQLHPNHSWARVAGESQNLRSRTKPADVVPMVAAMVRGAAVRFETIQASGTKSPVSGKALRDLVVRVLSESFDQKPPDDATLKKLTAEYRGKQTDRAAAKKAKAEERRQKQIEQKLAALPKPDKAVTDLPTFLSAIAIRSDKGKVDKATKMLKKEGFKLFNDVTAASLSGVVKSQTDPDLVYACRITSDGDYACCTQNLNICGGLRGSVCKHLLVLIFGLVQAGELDPATIDGWVAKSQAKAAELNKDAMGEIFLKYKGAEAGEIDWRPTETLPEDFYAV
jgi:uncharacterized protein YjbI with pentapeptide repeats